MTERSLPPGWAWTTLGEVAEYTNGRGFKKSEWGASGRPIIRIQNLTGSGNTYNYYSGDVLAKHIVEPNDLLVSWAATLSVHRWREPREGALNQHIFKVEASNAIESRFLEHSLRFVLADMYRAAHGSGIVHITRGKFEATPIALPPLSEQRRIVDVLEDHLSRLDAAARSLATASQRVMPLRASSVAFNRADFDQQSGAERLDQILSARAKLVKSKRRASPVSPGYDLDLPRGWITASVDQLSWDIQYGTSSKTGPVSSRSDVPVLRMGNIQDGDIESHNLKYLPADDPSIDGLILETGDLLFNRTNSAELVGKTAVFRDQLPRATFASYLIRCRPVPGVSTEWISHVANSPIGRRYVASVMSQQVGQANVNGTKLASMPIPIAPAQVERQLLEDISESRATAKRLHIAIVSANARSVNLRRSLLRAAFNGELVDQDPSDEPADVALAKLRAAATSSPQPRRAREKSGAAR